MRVNRVRLHVAAAMVAAISLGAERGFAEELIANVPFQFQVRDQQLPAGKYSVSQTSTRGAPMLLLRNWDTRKGVFVLPRTTISSHADTPPRMVFQCGEVGCAISEVWGATAGGGVEIAPPRHPGGSEQATLVYLTRQKNGR